MGDGPFTLLIPGNNPRSWTTADLQNINTVYDGTPSEASSQAVNAAGARMFIFFARIQRTGTPQDIQLIPQFSADGGTQWMDYRKWFWGHLIYDDTAVGASGFRRCWSGPECEGSLIRMKIVTQGVSGANFFTVSEARFAFKA